MARRLKQHSIEYTTRVSRQAAADVTHFLETAWPKTVHVHNVEDEPAFQVYDVDLLWTFLDKDGRLRTVPIEIKGDRLHHTGNFFLETVSNASKNTPGCFLYTKAEWLFYYFVEIGQLYCLPMDKIRPWFLQNIPRFPERQTSTPVGNGRTYITKGRLVPIATALSEVEGILQYQKQGEIWNSVSRES